MPYTKWIEKFLAPQGLNKANWKRLYRLLGRLADIYTLERVWLLRQHFALSCEGRHLARLGRIYALPRWSFESEGGYRRRLAAAGLELEARGHYGQLRWLLEGLFGPAGSGSWASNGEGVTALAVGQSTVGRASVGGISVLRVGIKPVNALIVGQSTVGRASVGGISNTAQENELRHFLDWFLAVDIEYQIYFL